MELLNYLKNNALGHENAIHRDSLPIITGVSDRKSRDMIEDLKHQGHPIANFGDGKGYFYCKTANECQRYIKQETARAKAIFHALKPFRRVRV